MAKLGIDFSTVEAATGKQPALPTGWQMLRVTKEEIKPTNNNATTGNELVAIEVEVVGGPFNGRKIFKNFNYKNENQQAQDIGWGEMKALNEATRTSGEDTAEWLNVEFRGYVVYVPKQIKWADEAKTVIEKEYDEKNEIRGFKTADDESVELNWSAPMTSGGARVNVSQDFAKGGSPVPTVGATAGKTAPSAPNKPSAPSKPSAPPSKPSAPPAKPKTKIVKQLQMTEKAEGGTAEQFRAHDPAWTDQALVDEGYAKWVDVEVPDDEPAAAPTPAPAEGTKKKAPWEK